MRQRDGRRTEQHNKVNTHHDKSHVDPVQHEAPRHKKVRTGIVSVYGRDVGEMRCTGGKHV